MFCEGFERKEAFQEYKNIGSKKKTLNICIFPNGLVHVFLQKVEIFPSFVFMQNG